MVTPHAEHSAILLLSAARGAGKTYAATEALRLARAEGLSVGGILAPGRLDAAGERVAIEALDAATEDRRTLAVVEREPALATVGRYRFDAATLAWSSRVILTALAAPLDVAVIDEIGRLELQQGGGYAPVLQVLFGARPANVLILVRDAFLADLQSRLGGLPQTVVRLDARNRDAAPGVMLRRWQRHIARLSRAGLAPY